MSARIVIISGPPGTGKTTVARILAENSTYEKAVHMEVDDFWQYIRKGYVHPWLKEGGDQNETVVEAVAASAESGYEALVAGTIGPWLLGPWQRLAAKGFDVRYIILLPNEETTVARALKREQRAFFPLSVDIIKDVRNSFAALGAYEANVIDTSGQTAEESAAAIQILLNNNEKRLTPEP